MLYWKAKAADKNLMEIREALVKKRLYFDKVTNIIAFKCLANEAEAVVKTKKLAFNLLNNYIFLN